MKNMILLYLCIIFLPLLEAILIYCFGRYMGKSLRIWGLLISFLSYLSSTIFFSNIDYSSKIAIILQYPKLNFLCNCSWEFFGDYQRFSLILFITTISLVVHLILSSWMYSSPYYLTKALGNLSCLTFFLLLAAASPSTSEFCISWVGVTIYFFFFYTLINEYFDD